MIVIGEVHALEAIAPIHGGHITVDGVQPAAGGVGCCITADLGAGIATVVGWDATVAGKAVYWWVLCD